MKAIAAKVELAARDCDLCGNGDNKGVTEAIRNKLKADESR